MNFWIPRKIIELSMPTVGLHLTGRTMPRVLRAKDAFVDKINHTFELIEKGVPESLIPKIDPTWFDLVWAGPWQENLLTTQGKNNMATTAYPAWWSYYARGIGTTTPAASDTTLASYSSSSSSLTALPSGTYANVHDYANGVIKHRRCWLFPQETTTTTYTEGGLASTSDNSVNTRFLLTTPVTVNAGEYYSPVYELEWQVTPTVTPASHSSPVLTGWATTAQSRFESLFNLLEPYSTSTGASLYNVQDVNPEYASELGFGSTLSIANVSSSSSTDTFTSAYNNGFWNILWPNWGQDPAPSSGYAYPGILVYASTFSNALTFSSSPVYPYTSGSATYGDLYQNTTIYEQAIASETNAPLTQLSYTDGTFTRTQRKQLDTTRLNISGIRSFGLCVHRSALGRSYYDVMSVYRMLLADAMVKDSNHILTIDFSQTWG